MPGPPPQVTVQPVEQRPLERTVEVVGSIFAEERVKISNEVPGVVARVDADLGDVVEPGQVLLQLEPKELELQVGIAKAGLAQAEARLVKARASAARARTLFPEEAISRERLDAVEAELGIAEADAEAARRQVALANKRLSDATIRAPFRAAVQERLVSLGQHVPPFTPLYELVAIVFAGYLVGWRKEKLGGILTIAGTILFYMVHIVVFGVLPMPAASLLAAPGAFYLLARRMEAHPAIVVAETDEH